MELHCNGSLSIVKTKGSRVIHKEMDEAVDDDVAWSCGRVIHVTFYDDVFLGLNFSFTTWATSREVGEESLSVFSNGCHDLAKCLSHFYFLFSFSFSFSFFILDLLLQGWSMGRYHVTQSQKCDIGHISGHITSHVT